MIEFDRRQFEEYARAVFTTDSPSGCTADAIALIKSYVEELGYTTHVHNKGTLEVDVPGLDESKTVATSAHVDTLGMMVRSVKSGGTLALTKVGGPICPTLDGEYCTVLTREGKRYSGTILSLAPAVHVYPDAATMPRDVDHLEVRLDEEVKSAEDVKALGIDNGDFVFIDPKFTMTGSGFLKSRFIDDKASAVLLLLLLRWCSEKKAAFRIRRAYTLLYTKRSATARARSRAISMSLSRWIWAAWGSILRAANTPYPSARRTPADRMTTSSRTGSSRSQRSMSCRTPWISSRSTARTSALRGTRGSTARARSSAAASVRATVWSART